MFGILLLLALSLTFAAREVRSAAIGAKQDMIMRKVRSAPFDEKHNITIKEVRSLVPDRTICVRYMEPLLTKDESHVSDLVFMIYEDRAKNDRIFNMTRSACTPDAIICVRLPFDPLVYRLIQIFTSVKVRNHISDRIYTKHFNGNLEHSDYRYFRLSLQPFACDVHTLCTPCEESCASVYDAVGMYSCQGKPMKRHIPAERLSKQQVLDMKERALIDYGRVAVKNAVRIPNANVTCLHLTYKLEKSDHKQGPALTGTWNPSWCEISTWKHSDGEHESIVCHDHGAMTPDTSMDISFIDGTTSHRISDFSSTQYSIGHMLPYAGMDVCELYSGKCPSGCYQSCNDLVSNPQQLFCNGNSHNMDRDMIMFNESFPVNFRYKGAKHIYNRNIVCLSFDSVVPPSDETTKFWTHARLLRPYAFKYVIECRDGGSETTYVNSSHCVSSTLVSQMTVCAKVNCRDPVRVVSLQGPLELKLFRERTTKKWSFAIFQATEYIVLPVELNTTVVYAPPVPCVEGCTECKETCHDLLEGNGRYSCAGENSSNTNMSHIPITTPDPVDLYGGNGSATLSTDKKNYSSAAASTNMSMRLNKNERVTTASYAVSDKSNNSTNFLMDPSNKTEITTQQIPDSTELYTFDDFFFPISDGNGHLPDMNCFLSVCLLYNILYNKHRFHHIIDRLLP